MLHSVAPATWLTQEAYTRLKRELDGLLNARGQQEESSQQMATESRIRQLTALLKNVNISEGQSMEVLRYANSVPLQFQHGACAITQAAIATNWRSYGLSQSRGPLPQGPLL